MKNCQEPIKTAAQSYKVKQFCRVSVAICVCALSIILGFIYWMGNSSSSMASPVVVNATAKHTASVSENKNLFVVSH